MTKHESIVLTAYTGILMCNFSDMQEYADKLLKRATLTHEFGSEKFQDKLKELCKAEFMAIVTNIKD